jgi:polyhydroxyalkanoate synthesis regulator phasin
MEDRMTGPTDMFEKMFLLGVGAFSLTREKVQETVDDLVERGRISQEQGRDVVSELGERGAKERDQFMDFIRDQIRRALERGDIATKRDIERLENEIALLRAEVLSGVAETATEAAAEDLIEGNL